MPSGAWGLRVATRAFFPSPRPSPARGRGSTPSCPFRASGNSGMMPGMFMACPSSFRPPSLFFLLCHSERSEESGFSFAHGHAVGGRVGLRGRERAFFSPHHGLLSQGEREPRDFAQRLDPPGLAVVARGCFPSPPASVADVLLKPFISVHHPSGCLDADHRRLVHPRQNAYVHQDRHHHPGNIPARAGHDSRKIAKRALPHGS